jgi:hypothetical protein
VPKKVRRVTGDILSLMVSSELTPIRNVGLLLQLFCPTNFVGVSHSVQTLDVSPHQS